MTIAKEFAKVNFLESLLGHGESKGSKDLEAQARRTLKQIEDVYRPTEVDERDARNRDGWLKRHPAQIRSSGLPLNSETPLALLLDAGFITPTSLHFVRNAGPVPKLDARTHTLTVTGNVKQDKTFTMDQIAKMPAQTLPVTLVCAGNRRKEMNMLKQTTGSNWGPGAVSTNLWTGVPLRVFLNKCGITKATTEAQHVCFRGPERELSHSERYDSGGDGTYGTSIPMCMALDPAADVIIAYKANHEELHPDHGYPLRVIIPGWVESRSVKWLTEITISDKPTDNFHHYHDHAMLPPEVATLDVADQGEWWYKPEYAFNAVNINSAMANPQHNSIVYATEDHEVQTVPVNGYAYAGGGNRLHRVEISLDDGLTWKFAEINRAEVPTAHSKHWCWVNWSVVLTVKQLLDSPSGRIQCRAWDEANNTQPLEIAWNLLGLGHNSVYTINIHKYEMGEMVCLLFEHPVVPGDQVGGWMGSAAGGWRPDPTQMGQMPDSAGGLGPIAAQVAAPLTQEELMGKANAWPEGEVALNPRAKVNLKLVHIEEVSHNTRIFTYALPSPDHVLGLPIGKHVLISARVDDKPVMRAYTPLSTNNDKGVLRMLIKVYFKTDLFPKGGILSQNLNDMQIGESIAVKGPIGHVMYRGSGEYTVNKTTYHAKKLVLLAGGTGITPMWQVMLAVLNDPTDPTMIYLVFANSTLDDVLLFKEIEALASMHPDRLKVWFTLSVPPLEPVQQKRRHTKTWGKLFKGAFGQLPSVFGQVQSGLGSQQNPGLGLSISKGSGLGFQSVKEDSRMSFDVKDFAGLSKLKMDNDPFLLGGSMQNDASRYGEGSSRGLSTLKMDNDPRNDVSRYGEGSSRGDVAFLPKMGGLDMADRYGEGSSRGVGSSRGEGSSRGNLFKKAVRSGLLRTAKSAMDLEALAVQKQDEVDEPPSKVWKYGSGRVNEAMLTEHLCPITDDVTAMLCGPDPFMHKTCIPILKKFGIQEDRIVLF